MALALQADPSALADDSTATAHVTVDAGAAGSVVIPVSLAKGYVWQPAPVVAPPGGHRVFMPLAIR